VGFWGFGLYENDTTCDVRDSFLDFIQDNLSNGEAYEKTMKQFHECINDQDEPLLWLALAETQWSVGRLQPEVLEKALLWIDTDGYLEVWGDNHAGAIEWKAALRTLGEKLKSPMPKEKKFPKLSRNPWNLHDVYAYQFHREESKATDFFGKYMLMQKIGESTYGEKHRLLMRVQVIDHLFCDLPVLEDISNYRILPMDDLRNIERRVFNMNEAVSIAKQSENPSSHILYLGTLEGPANTDFTGWCDGSLDWLSIEHYLGRYFNTWQGREYTTVSEGVYKYTST